MPEGTSAPATQVQTVTYQMPLALGVDMFCLLPISVYSHSNSVGFVTLETSAQFYSFLQQCTLKRTRQSEKFTLPTDIKAVSKTYHSGLMSVHVRM